MSLSEAVYPPVDKYLVPVLSRGVEGPYRQWVPYLARNLVRTACVSVAFLVQRVISGFYSSIRGGQLVATGLLAYLVRYGYIGAQHEVCVFVWFCDGRSRPLPARRTKDLRFLPWWAPCL